MNRNIDKIGVSTLSIILGMVCFMTVAVGGDLTVTKIFTTGEALTATDLNTTFGEVEAAVTDNHSQITTHQTTSDAHHIRYTDSEAVNANATMFNQMFSGDGSASELTISSNTSWATAPPAGNNLNFTNVVIDAGSTLTVPAGTTMRCTGTFTNNGTITVVPGADKRGSGFSPSNDVTYNGRATSNGHPGDSYAPASSPDWHNDFTANSVAVDGAYGGTAIPKTVAASSFNSFRIGGGSGSGHSSGSEGGGLIKIYCSGAITNAGTITANGNVGSSAAGGGGGGIVIVGSQTSVDNTAGSITVTGGLGGGGAYFGGHGGGGGGGIVVLVAPTINSAGGSISVLGGAAGASGTTTATSNVRVGGGGGGASGGDGGYGAAVSSASAIGTAGAGNAGYSHEIVANPANMM